MLHNLRDAKASNYDFGHRYFWTSQSDNPLVLMVEDQDDARAGMKEILELNGYRVIDTDNGQDAVKRARLFLPI